VNRLASGIDRAVYLVANRMASFRKQPEYSPLRALCQGCCGWDIPLAFPTLCVRPEMSHNRSAGLATRLSPLVLGQQGMQEIVQTMSVVVDPERFLPSANLCIHQGSPPPRVPVPRSRSKLGQTAVRDSTPVGRGSTRWTHLVQKQSAGRTPHAMLPSVPNNRPLKNL
jgi:hypothetical protein